MEVGCFFSDSVVQVQPGRLEMVQLPEVSQQDAADPAMMSSDGLTQHFKARWHT